MTQGKEEGRVCFCSLRWQKCKLGVVEGRRQRMGENRCGEVRGCPRQPPPGEGEWGEWVWVAGLRRCVFT